MVIDRIVPDTTLPLHLFKRQDYDSLRNLFHQLGYTTSDFRQSNIDPYRRSFAEYAVLIQKVRHLKFQGIGFYLFFLGNKVLIKDLAAIIPVSMIKRYIHLSILEETYGNAIQSKVSILPYHNLFFTCDFLFRFDYSEDKLVLYSFKETVYPISHDSINLWESVVKKKYRSVFDLGTGCGFHAIISSLISQKVAAVDINPRAINYSNFNFRLNQAGNIEFKLSNLFESAAGEKYDLIVANPPSIKSILENGDISSLSQKPGINILEKIISSIPDHLSDDGFSHVNCTIHESEQDEFRKSADRWLGQNKKKYKILYLILSESDPYHYSWLISHDLLKADYKIYLQQTENLVKYFQRLKIKKISNGILIMKKSLKAGYSEKKYLPFLPLKTSPEFVVSRYFK